MEVIWIWRLSYYFGGRNAMVACNKCVCLEQNKTSSVLFPLSAHSMANMAKPYQYYGVGVWLTEKSEL